MTDRTLFSRQPVLGAGTGQVQSLRSYIQRLGLAHSLKPRKVLQVLRAHYPDVPETTAANGLTGDFNIHSSGVAVRLRKALESATGVDLSTTTFELLAAAYSMSRSAGGGAMRYCPACAQEGDGLPYGRLLWDLDFVTCCPVHGVKLRNHKICGAPAAGKLPLQNRPSADGVCPMCGSLGFRCIREAPEVASASELQVATDAERLIAHVARTHVALCPDRLRAGVTKIVEARWGASPVRASEGTGLARSSVWTWLKAGISPSLPLMIQFCVRSNADLLAATLGEFRALHQSATNLSLRASYRHSNVSTETLKQLLIDASKADIPPTVYEFSRGLGVHIDTPRRRAPEEAKLLAAANSRAAKKRVEQQFAYYRRRFHEAAVELARDGLPVHRKSVQTRSGIPTFSRGMRRAALDQALAEFGIAQPTPGSAPTQKRSDRMGLLLKTLEAQLAQKPPPVSVEEAL